MSQVDYTDSQTEAIKRVRGAAHIKEAEECSKTAELLYKAKYGFRNTFNHVKATTMLTGPFHFSVKWQGYLKFSNNITVFYRKDQPVGWLYHKEILANLDTCPFDGKDLNCTLRSIDTYTPNHAS